MRQGDPANQIFRFSPAHHSGILRGFGNRPWRMKLRPRKNPMKMPSFPVFALALWSLAAFVPAYAGSPVQLGQSKEHCETQCTLNHETCQSDVSDSISECDSRCEDDACSRCQENMDVAALEQCQSQCNQCKTQCDTAAESRGQACDVGEQECLGKCMGVD